MTNQDPPLIAGMDASGAVQVIETQPSRVAALSSTIPAPGGRAGGQRSEPLGDGFAAALYTLPVLSLAWSCCRPPGEGFLRPAGLARISLQSMPSNG